MREAVTVLAAVLEVRNFLGSNLDTLLDALLQDQRLPGTAETSSRLHRKSPGHPRPTQTSEHIEATRTYTPDGLDL